MAEDDSSVALKLSNKPALVEYNNFRFLIMDSPNDKNLGAYIEVLKKKNVKQVVRACDPMYDKEIMAAAGLPVLELPFPDGDPPPADVVEAWLNVVDDTFSGRKKKPPTKEDYTGVGPTNGSTEGNAIAVHCVAGLGRAPVLVAIALLEAGMTPVDAIDLIRKKRRGAINSRQLKFLESYKPRNKARGCCVIS